MNENYTGTVSDEQIKRLLTPPRSSVIEKVQGMSYLPHHELRAELNRTFGPTRWDHQTIAMDLLYETQEGETAKSRWRVAYRCGVRLRVRDLDGNPLAEYVEYHSDETLHPSRGEAHANAMTSAQSYALRRAAIDLGDACGLTLYAGGSTTRLTKGTLLNGFGTGESQTTAKALTPEQAKMLKDSLGATQVVSDGEPNSAGTGAQGPESVSAR